MLKARTHANWKSCLQPGSPPGASMSATAAEQAGFVFLHVVHPGAVERRVRLMRPMEHPAILVADLSKTQWREADRAEFIQAWEAELAALPEFTDSTLHIVTGETLPESALDAASRLHAEAEKAQARLQQDGRRHAERRGDQNRAERIRQQMAQDDPRIARAQRARRLRE